MGCKDELSLLGIALLVQEHVNDIEGENWMQFSFYFVYYQYTAVGQSPDDRTCHLKRLYRAFRFMFLKIP